MTLLTWSHSCTVGVRAMDDQHGILFDAMNDLRLSVQRGRGRDLLCAQLESIIQLVLMHLACEERLMERTGYPGLADHCIAHRRLLQLFRESTDHLQQGVNVQMTPLLAKLGESYREHFEGPDQGYGPWLKAHGVN